MTMENYSVKNNDVFRDGALSTVFVDGKACNKETFEDIRERLNGGNKDE